MKRTIFRTDLFEQQLDEQLEWYVQNTNDTRVPRHFLDAVEQSVNIIAESPELFSRLIPAKGYEMLNMYNLRFKRIDKSFPFYIFYQYDDDTITLRFIWHDRRDWERLLLEEF